MQDMISILVNAHSQSDAGRCRENNEDACLIKIMKLGDGRILHIFCVGDGLGGVPAGEVASALAMATIAEYFERIADYKNHSFGWLAAQAVEMASVAIYVQSLDNKHQTGMATTITLALACNDHLYISHVGDSRAYILRGSRLVQVTHDHNVFQELLDSNLSLDRVENYEDLKSMLTRALGKSTVEVDTSCIRLFRGDTLLLCSDGLHGMLSDSKIQTDLIATNGNAQAGCNRLIQHANDAGGSDNITAVVAHFGGNSLDPPTEKDIHQLEFTLLDIAKAEANTDPDSKPILGDR